MSGTIKQILLFVLFPALCMGQKEIKLNSEPLIYQGKSLFIFVKMLNKESGLEFNGATISFLSGSVKDDLLRLGFYANEGDLGLKISVATQKGLSSQGNFQTANLEMVPAQFNFKIAFEPSQKSSSITLKIFNEDNSFVKEYTIPVILKSSESDAYRACMEINPLEKRLACLENISSNLESIKEACDNLRMIKGKAQEGLIEFKLSRFPGKKNTYQIKCRNCDPNQYDLEWSPKNLNAKITRNNKGWDLLIPAKVEAIITSRQWTSLPKRTFSLEYTPEKEQGKQSAHNGTRNEPPKTVIQEEEESEDIINQEEEKPQDTVPEKTPPILAEKDTNDQDPNPPQENPLPQPRKVDLLWQDSIAPLLDSITLFGQNDSLNTLLLTYLERGTYSSRKGAAFLLLYRVPFLFILGALVLGTLVYYGLKRKKKITAVELPKNEQLVSPSDNSNPVALPNNVQEETAPLNDYQKEVAPQINVQEETIPPDNIQEEAQAVEQADGEIEIEEVSQDQTQEATNKLSLAQVMDHPDYITINLTACWEDTMVSRIYFSKSSIRDIAEFLREKNAYSIHNNKNQDLPEIGGFLLGYFYPIAEGEFQAAITVFTPITPEKNDRYTVKFGDKAWSELGDAYKIYPGHRLLGWFHTHPGHGLFLSNADIEVHHYAFDKHYQFAMEIDPKTPERDIAFFTWKKTGEMNNKEDRKIFKWMEFNELESKSALK